MEAGFFVYPGKTGTELKLHNERQSTVRRKKMMA
jgi:hypothetical protein